MNFVAIKFSVVSLCPRCFSKEAKSDVAKRSSLSAPDFNRPSKIAVGVSVVAAGAVLLFSSASLLFSLVSLLFSLVSQLLLLLLLLLYMS